ncbi:MAG: hypothetical protein JJ879_07305 [Sneathiella sp.]|nr:hypothetical protein [Sneathiella sp.]
MTRQIGSPVIVSDAVVKAAGGASFAGEAGFKHHGPVDVRGRDEAVDIWTL